MPRHQPAEAGGVSPVWGVLGPVVEGLGLVLDDVTLTSAGRRRMLRVVLDLPVESSAELPVDAAAQDSLSLDAVAQAAREISATLDSSDVMGGTPYVLEVTSPGVERPLTEPRHFRRNLRRKVVVTLADGSQVEGRITTAADELTLSVQGAKKGTTQFREIAWPDVVQGLVQVEFAPAAGPDPDSH